MKTIFALISLAMAACAAELDFPQPLGHVVEGVYYLQNPMQTTIVELKDGQYRFWFSSGAKIGWETTKYPLTGKYATNGGQITLVSTNTYVWDTQAGKTPQTHHRLRTNLWTFMNLDGKPSLWRPGTLEHWKANKLLDGYGILRPTDKKPEEIWRGN